MTHTQEQRARQARGQIAIAIRRLVQKYPFHVATLERFTIRCRPDVATMAVTVAGDDVLLLYNPDFVLEISADELGGVLLHEVHHVVFGHVVADPADYPDHWARTISEEVTVNEFVTEPLPGSPICLEQYPGLPAMESTHDRYERLRRQAHRPPIAPPVSPSQDPADEASGGPATSAHD